MKFLLIIISLCYSLIATAQDVTSPEADCDKLLNATLPFAEKMLKAHGEFFPYGAALNFRDEIVHVAGYDGRERPPSKDVILFIKNVFLQKAKLDGYKATALVYDARIVLPSTGNKSDAIVISLNHLNDYSVKVIFPYVLSDGQLIIGEEYVERGEADVFNSMGSKR